MKSKKTPGPYAAFAKAHREHVRPLVDQDYLSQLSPEELRYLADFNDAFYSAKYDSPVGQAWTEEQRREGYMDYRRSEAAVRLEPSVDPTLDPDSADTSPDGEEPPAYLNHPAYKAALQAWRNEPDSPPGRDPSGRRRVRAKTPSNSKRAAYRTLQGIIRLGQAGLLDEPTED